jgi:hypothetical protein
MAVPQGSTPESPTCKALRTVSVLSALMHLACETGRSRERRGRYQARCPSAYKQAPSRAATHPYPQSTVYVVLVMLRRIPGCAARKSQDMIKLTPLAFESMLARAAHRLKHECVRTKHVLNYRDTRPPMTWSVIGQT